MAGSLDHIAGEDGSWRLIENMPDAHEACEEMLWLILRTIGYRAARDLLNAEFYPMMRGEIPHSQEFIETRLRMRGRV